MSFNTQIIDKNYNPTLESLFAQIDQDYNMTTLLIQKLISDTPKNNFSEHLLKYLLVYCKETELFLVTKELKNNHYQAIDEMIDNNNRMRFGTLGHLFHDKSLLKGYCMFRIENFIVSIFTILEICITDVYEGLKSDDDLKFKRYNEIEKYLSKVSAEDKEGIKKQLVNNHISFKDKVNLIKKKLDLNKKEKKGLRVFELFMHCRNVIHNNGRYNGGDNFVYKTNKGEEIILKSNKFVGLTSNQTYIVMLDLLKACELIYSKLEGQSNPKAIDQNPKLNL